MFDQNEVYRIFNQQLIQAQIQQQYHNEQVWKVSDCARKLDDFLKCVEDIAPEYQQLAFNECCAILGKHMR